MKKDNIPPHPMLKYGRYRHYKGGEYEVLMLACNEATHEWCVVYKALYDTGANPKVWIRTVEDFTASVEMAGKTVKRFIKIDEGRDR